MTTAEIGLYDHHVETANHWLNRDDSLDDVIVHEDLTRAQIHATLAVAAAINHLADSYNGWKDLGR